MYYPPTDSLYKFCAMTGIIIILFSIYYPITLRHKLQIEIDNVKKEQILQKANIEFQKAQVNDMTEIISNTIALNKGEYVPDVEKLVFIYSNDELKDIIYKIETEIRDFKISLGETELNTQKVIILFEKVKFINILSTEISRNSNIGNMNSKKITGLLISTTGSHSENFWG